MSSSKYFRGDDDCMNKIEITQLEIDARLCSIITEEVVRGWTER